MKHIIIAEPCEEQLADLEIWLDWRYPEWDWRKLGESIGTIIIALLNSLSKQVADDTTSEWRVGGTKVEYVVEGEHTP